MESMAEILERVTEASMRNLTDNVYEKDGILYCIKCNTPRQTTIKNPFTGEDNVVGCICKCQKEALEREKAEAEQRHRQAQIDALQRDSLLGERYKEVAFKNTETGVNKSFDEAFARCRKYCEAAGEVLENGYGIYIFGDKGTGKTRLTACMANDLIGQGRPVMFTNFFEISEIIRKTYSKQSESESAVISKLANIDFLFIDDLGTEKVTQGGEDNWLQGKIFEILNKRYNNKKPTIFTSNHSPRELVEERGMMDKTVDRIVEMSSAILKITGKSYRQKARTGKIPF